MIFTNPRVQPLSDNGRLIPGAKLYFYAPDSTDTVVVYQDAEFSTAHAQPVVADSAGLFPAIYYNADVKAVLWDAAGNELWDTDNITDDTDAANIDYTAPYADAVSVTLESLLGRILHVADFGAVGDGTTDDTDAIKAACVALQSLGGGMLLFDPKTYLIYPTGTLSAGLIMNSFTSLNGVAIDGRGATLSIQDVFLTGETVVIFKFDTCKNVEVRNFFPTQTPFSPSNGAGQSFIALEDACENVVMENIHQIGGQYMIFAYRTGNETTKASQIRITNCYVEDVYVPLSFQNSGDNVFVRNVKGLRPGRMYFPYGVRNHDVDVEFSNPGLTPSCCLTAYGNDTTMNYLENIKLRARNTSSGSSSAVPVGIVIQVTTGIINAVAIRNIQIQLDMTWNNSSSAYYGVTLTKQLDGAADTVDRGHIVENIVISGAVHSANSAHYALNLMSTTGGGGTWGASELIRNLVIRDFIVTGTTGIAIIGVAGIKDALTLENVQLPGALTLEGTPQRGTFYRNCIINSVYYDDTLVESTSASAIVTRGQRRVIELQADVASSAATTFQDVTGLAAAVVSGVNYRFRATLLYTTSVATIGMRASIAIPSVTHCAYTTQVSVGAAGGGTAQTFENWQTAADSGTTSADSMTTTGGNLCIVEGILRPSAGGTLQIRFAPETATASGVIIEAGSTLEVW